MSPVGILVPLVVGYLLGAIPFAVLIARSRGVNIFELGSGNPGATNVLRNLGKKLGYLCFLLDALKGFAAAGWPLLWGPQVCADSSVAWMQVIGLIGAILGHSFSVFIRFRGGKGVATTIGGLLAVVPWVVLIGIVVWLITFYTTRYVSFASILLGLSLPISGLILGVTTPGLLLVCLIAVLIVVRHRSNIQRLLKGEESRFSKSGKKKT